MRTGPCRSEQRGDVGSGQWARGPRGRRAPGTEPTLRLLPSQRGTYLPQTYIIQEEMVVTEHVSDKEALGSFIYHLCSGKDTYRLRRRATRRRINKRGAKNCNAIRHFENTFVVETLICGVV